MLPSSLADAVMRELRERSSVPPPIVQPSDLRPRTSSAPAPPPSIDRRADPIITDADDVVVGSSTEIDTVYEARALTPSSPGSEAVQAVLPEPSVSLPLPLVHRANEENDDTTKKP